MVSKVADMDYRYSAHGSVCLYVFTKNTLYCEQ